LAAISLAVVVVLGFAHARAADGIKLAGHRAVYELSLARREPSGSVMSLRVRLVIEFSDVCDGYALNQRIRTEITNGDDNDEASDFTTSSWEARDGRHFRFSLRNEVSGETTEEHVGKGDLDPGGKGGSVPFTKPVDKRMTLPART